MTNLLKSVTEKSSMNSTQNFLGYFSLALKLNQKLRLTKHQLGEGIQEWLRQEIVDDDPCDEETFFPQPGTIHGVRRPFGP